MPVIYNNPRELTLTTSGGPIRVYNNLQTMVDRPSEGFNVELKRHVAETDGRALVWMHHGYTRDVLRAFSNRGRSTRIENEREVRRLTLAEYEEHLSRVEKYAFNWTGIVFCFVEIEGLGGRKTEKYLDFLRESARLRTQRHPLAMVIVPTFRKDALPYLVWQRGDEKFLNSRRPTELRDFREFRNRSWQNFMGYLQSLGIHRAATFHIGERYSDYHFDLRVGDDELIQENERCVGAARERLGGRILNKYCFPGRFGTLLDFQTIGL